MLLSILVPVFNVAKYLPDLLDDLFSKLTLDVEVIFYDDASLDNSVSLIEKCLLNYPEVQVQIIHGRKNIGLTLVREHLLKATKADYVWFIDSDDRVESNYLEEIFLILRKKQPDIMVFDYDVFWDESQQIKHRETLSFYPKNTLVETSTKQIYRTAILDGRHYFWNKIFKRKLIENVVCFNIPAFEDIAYVPILMSKCKSFYYFPQAVIHYRIRKNSIAQKISLQQGYAIEAYIRQAHYAETVLKDKKSRAYLLYKACIYYFRILKKIKKADISSSFKNELEKLSDHLFAKKIISEWDIVCLLTKEKMYFKAIKLNFYLIFKRRFK